MPAEDQGGVAGESADHELRGIAVAERGSRRRVTWSVRRISLHYPVDASHTIAERGSEWMPRSRVPRELVETPAR